ncbi:MAG: ATP-grasp domain-containing protein [Verrucomicrobia bacterium]|nr:ATP-grasp domain-containing protein [Verrucomicrobiota bacterium]
MAARKYYSDLHVAVSGLHTGDNPQPGVAVIQSLREGGFRGRVVGLVYDAIEAGIWAGAADHVFQMPYPSEGSESFLSRLAYICERYPLAALIPTLDVEIMAYIRLAPQLTRLGIRTFLPTEEQFRLRAKTKLGELGARFGIRVPPSVNLSDPAMIRHLPGQMLFPVMVKGQFYEAFRANRLDEVLPHFNRIRSAWGLPVVIQQYLQGDEYNTVALGDGRGGCVGAVSMRKMLVTEKGKGFGGVVVQDPELDRFSRRIMKGLSWRGPLELEVLKAQQDGCYYLLEINPRFPAWVLLAARAGQNLPLAALRLAFGEKVRAFRSCRAGVFFVRHSVDITHDISLFGDLSSRGELCNIGGQTRPER